MGLVAKFDGIKRVALDTSPLIYFFEKHPIYLAQVKPLFEKIARGEIEAFTSTVTLIEVLVLPLRKKKSETAIKYEEFLLNSANLTMLEITAEIARKAAELRAKYSLRTPDAIQLAVGILNNVDVFLTNDSKLKIVSEIKVETLGGQGE